MVSQASSLAQLPNEILQSILEWTNPQTAIALGRVSRRFHGVTDEPLLWRNYCLSEYDHWSDRNHIKDKLASKEPVDWKSLFQQRRDTDRSVVRTLDETIGSQRDRSGKFESLIECGYDAKDILLRNLHVGFDADDYLARRYWSYAALGSIHRDVALRIWGDMRQSPSSGCSLEQALGAFNLFIREATVPGLADVTDRLDQIAHDIRAEHPNIAEISERQRAHTVAEFLLRHRLVGINSDREYHSLSHNFIGIALSAEDHSSLPLITVAIYCAVCSRLGLNAVPCSFPYHVHAMVYAKDGFDLDGAPSPEKAPPMYIDPWRSAEEVDVTALQEQLSMLPTINQLSQSRDAFLAASPVTDITLRCARNILNSIQQFGIRATTTDDESHRIHVPSARYSALWASVVLSSPPPSLNTQPGIAGTFPNQFLHLHHELLTLLHLFASDFPHDAHLIEKHLLPTTRTLGGRYLNYMSTVRHMRRQDAQPRTEKRRSKYPAGHLKFKVGQVFKHERYGYRAVIIGWDARCEARDEWIATMGVDNLYDGREQPFYNALVLEDLSTRYVASENISLVLPPETDEFFPYPPEPVDGLISGDFALEVGKYFRRWDRDEGRFVSAIDDEYPEG